MKKALSIFLSIVIVMSCCAVISVSAADGGEEQQPVYLLGDTDLDEVVTVLDATEIQRALADLTELSGLQTALGDVFGTGLDITCATAIQRYLAGFEDDLSIGETAGDENEGVIYSEVVPWYFYSNGIMEEDRRLFFSTAYPEVPFISDNDAVNLFSMSLGYGVGLTPAEGSDDVTHIYEMHLDTSVIFDYANDRMIFSDYTTMLTINGAMTYNPFSASFPCKTALYRTSPMDRYYGGDPMVATFRYDEVPMLMSGSDILIPLQSFSDLFFSFAGMFCQYNGKGVFQLSTTTASNPEMSEYWQLYTDVTKRTSISKEWAQVNYYELCNALDARYGLQAAHNIRTFDEYFSRKGIKSKMLSGDLNAIERAEVEISIMLFEDFHSSPNITSPFLETPIVPDASMASPIYANRGEKFSAITSARASAIPEVTPYERRGDTVYITFDKFTFSGIFDRSAEDYVPTPDGDTVDLFAYALRRLENEDSDAKNVVIDLACNGGGTVISCGYILDAVIGKSIICLQNPNTYALHQCVFKFDLNLDGSIDENDRSMLAMGKNVAVIISDHSFSCGNALPCTLDALDDRVLLLGQTSGGGACEVGYLTTSTGAFMQISSEYRFVTMKNGYIRDIDGGVDPDIYLSLDRMFDRDYITAIVEDQFG